ncbi:MAG: DNA gyrase inhibitor YacG [Blastocatellia bacterium]|nr:DNA gyrase inhibitor YacG [Blastocatellia bacterium]
MTATMRKCPLCRKETKWEDNPWRPFCSERCQMIDLGRWASEEYRVPVAETAEGVTLDFEREPGSDEQM